MYACRVGSNCCASSPNFGVWVVKNLLLAFLAISLTVPASAQSIGEWVAQPALPSLIVAFEHHRGGSTIVERVAPGESVENWTMMVTNQRFAGLIAGGATIDDWLANFRAGLSGACPGFREHPMRRIVVSGRPAIELRLDCPLNPATNLPETFFWRVIAGRADLHVTQMAFRRVPSARDEETAQAFLAGVSLCTRADQSALCATARQTPEAH